MRPVHFIGGLKGACHRIQISSLTFFTPERSTETADVDSAEVFQFTVRLNMPKVSVCIPTYRCAATIGATIESVLAQSSTDLELIVIDDGSPDETSSIVERFTDPRNIYLRNLHNQGPQGNWNRCLELAKGDYFKLLPHDDLLHPRCLERQVAVMDADMDEKLALLFCAREVIGPDGRLLMNNEYFGSTFFGAMYSQ